MTPSKTTRDAAQLLARLSQPCDLAPHGWSQADLCRALGWTRRRITQALDALLCDGRAVSHDGAYCAAETLSGRCLMILAVLEEERAAGQLLLPWTLRELVSEVRARALGAPPTGAEVGAALAALVDTRRQVGALLLGGERSVYWSLRGPHPRCALRPEEGAQGQWRLTLRGRTGRVLVSARLRVEAGHWVLMEDAAGSLEVAAGVEPTGPRLDMVILGALARAQEVA